MKDIIITIDGPAASGKSTIAKLLANKLNYTYIDSGSMYRCVTLYKLNNNLDNNTLINKLNNIKISFDTNNKVYLNNEDVTNIIRSDKITNIVTSIASIKEVRMYLVSLQQAYGHNKRIVMDGRDIGSVVFKDADIKIYLEASIEARAKRRLNDDKNLDNKDYDKICKDIKKRDYEDMNRSISPLIKPDKAYVIDSSNDCIEDTLNKILKIIKDSVN